MHTFRTVFFKELVDNFRDRRTLISALVMGPLFGPILFAFVINLSLKQSLSNNDEPLDVPVIGAEYAPNLVAFSRQPEHQRLSMARQIAMPGSMRCAMASTTSSSLCRRASRTISPRPGPPRVEVITDQSNTTAERESRRTVRALASYNQQIAGLRLSARGVNPAMMQPMNIDLVDVSTPSGRSAMLLGMLSYFFIFALLTGGMNLAIDSTAGRTRTGLAGAVALPARHPRPADLRQDFRRLFFHGAVAVTQPRCVFRHAEVRTAATARHGHRTSACRSLQPRSCCWCRLPCWAPH